MTTKPLRTEPEKRLHSLDALRGFDMFWITGGGYLATIIAQMTGAEWLGHQMHHVEWAGFHFEDLIFPLFMFIAGVAVPFSIGSKLEKNVPKRRLFLKVFKRLVVLILLGILYNGAFKEGFANARIASVLGQIGIGYFFAALIYLNFPVLKSRIFWLIGILAGFGILQLLIPVPGVDAGVLTPEGCINGYIDRLFLPGRLYRGVYDPEGILCSLSATGVTLMGTIAGSILRNKKNSDWKKISYLSGTGAGLIVLALLFSTFYPIIKNCWTSTFNMLTGGIGFLLLAFFFLIIDHWKFRSWAFYFKIIGMNSIFVYLFHRIIDTQALTVFFAGWLAKPLGNASELFLAICELGLIWLLLYFMYRRKIFLRV
ncbi:MAG: acyltransferase family protein [Draconibacterium sp.]